MVPRGRLVELLHGVSGADPSPATLVCAPAGYGKTTLMATWAGRRTPRRSRRVGWVQLDDDDNDPLRLWSSILAALEATGGDRAERLACLNPPRDGADPGFLAAFIDAVDEDRRPVWLVLDDAHRLRTGPATSGLDALLHRLPRLLRLVLVCRFEPPLAELRRFRLDGRLREIREHDLTFARDEAVALLDGHGVRLRDRDLDLVLARTEGWPAALRLAGLAMAGTSDVSAAVAAFVCDDRNVADYLIGEVLARQPEHVRRFVLATSVCEQFTAELAEAVTGHPGAAAILDRLERSNALISRTGPRRTWYRYHSLLRSYLYAELQRQHAAAALHRRAAAWLEGSGDLTGAVHHAIAAGDPDTAARLVSGHGVRLATSGRAALLRRLLAVLPAGALTDPAVALVAALVSLDGGDPDAADRCLTALNADVTSHVDQRLRALHAAVRLRRATSADDLHAAMAEIEPLVATPSGGSDLDQLLLADYGTAALRLGHHAAAQSHLSAALELAHRGGNDHLALHCVSHLAAVRCAEGDFAGTQRLAEQAVEVARANGWTASARCAHAYALAALAAFQRMDRPAAQRFAALSVQVLDGSGDPAIVLLARIVGAVVRFDNGDQRRAHGQWQAAWNEVADATVSPALVAGAAPVELRMALALGEVEEAAQTVERLRRLPGADGEVLLLRAILNTRRGRTDIARRLLRPVLDDEAPHVIVTTVLEAHLLEAVLAHADDEPERTRRALVGALDLAVPRRALRPFSAAGAPARDLLVRYAGSLGRHDAFVTEVLAATVPHASVLPDPLTPRERQLLAELPSMQTVEQMADKFVLSVSTVKTHLRAVYRKLGVASRREAVTSGRHHGLI